MTTAQRRRWRISRDSIIFTIGIAGIVYETLARNGEQPTLLVLFAAMIGLPAFLHGDEQLRPPPPEPPPPPPPPQLPQQPTEAP